MGGMSARQGSGAAGLAAGGLGASPNMAVQARAQPTAAQAAGSPPAVSVREAREQDLEAIVACVSDLLRELGSEPPPASAMLQSTRTLFEDPAAGALLVAQAGEAIVGVLAASWQLALHVPGRYALIQDLWVHPDWRSRAVGGELLAALFALAHARGMARAEVGLPRESFPAIAATEAFYVRNGFAPLGPRMRRLLR
jgi:branched-chain amino acid aminotransferase